MTEIRRFNFTTDKGAGARARIGLLVLESDHTIEAEFRVLTGLKDVAVYHARLANQAVVSEDSLALMESELPIAAKLLPEYLNLDAIGYGCTSGATIIGEAKVADIMRQAHPNAPSSNPLSAGLAALGALGVSRIALLTPYAPEVTDAMRAKFEASGIEIVSVGSFYEANDVTVAKIDESSIRAAALELGHDPRVDGIFVSCTSLRVSHLVAELEAKLNKPVTASNHALAWHLLRLAGVNDAIDGAGRLFVQTL